MGKPHLMLTTRFLHNPYSRSITKLMIGDIHRTCLKQPGFIYGKSFWSNNKSVLYTITKWKSSNCWDQWINSNARKELMKHEPTEVMTITHENIDKFEHPDIVKN